MLLSNSKGSCFFYIDYQSIEICQRKNVIFYQKLYFACFLSCKRVDVNQCRLNLKEKEIGHVGIKLQSR